MSVINCLLILSEDDDTYNRQIKHIEKYKNKFDLPNYDVELHYSEIRQRYLMRFISYYKSNTSKVIDFLKSIPSKKNVDNIWKFTERYYCHFVYQCVRYTINGNEISFIDDTDYTQLTKLINKAKSIENIITGKRLDNVSVINTGDDFLKYFDGKVFNKVPLLNFLDNYSLEF